MAQPTSAAAFQNIKPALPSIQQMVLALLRQHPDSTSLELTQLAGYEDGRKINRRLSELCDQGRIVSSGTRQCSQTKQEVRVYRIPVTSTDKRRATLQQLAAVARKKVGGKMPKLMADRYCRQLAALIQASKQANISVSPELQDLALWLYDKAR